MTVDLLHNKIVKDTLTDAFADSVRRNLLPTLEAAFGEELLGIRMYEDYLADAFMREGNWYYPLTLLLSGGARTLWIYWAVDKKRFKNACPYAYVGEGDIEFAIADRVPDGFTDAMRGRAITYSPDSLPISVSAEGVDPCQLAGKYSQSFIDELAAQLTVQIGTVMSVEGLTDSTLRLELPFAPGTYMEHTSEGVTYRRLLLCGKGCQARDFWVKWTRQGSGEACTVSDHSVEGVIFSLGEDAAQKIREKEYRFLCFTNPDKYRAAMSKRTVTEWRDIIKVAVRRGELRKVEALALEDKDEQRINEQLAALLESIGKRTANAEPVQAEPLVDESVDAEEHAAAEYWDDTDGALDSDVMADLVRLALGEEDAPAAEPVLDTDSDDGADMMADLVRLALGEEGDGHSELLLDTDESEEYSDAEGDDFVFAGLEYTDESRAELDASEEFAEETEAADEEEYTDEPIPAARVSEEDIRAEIEARLRAELEREARAEAEERQRLLEEERQRLIAENERLQELARRAEEDRIREAEERRAEAERIRREEDERRRLEEAESRRIAERMRLEAEERARLAETARLAVEEQRRMEAEKAERDMRQREAALREERERLLREEEQRRREERRREEERARLEAKLRAEERAAQERMAPTSFVKKQIKLLFARNLDLNVLKRIKEIVEDTIVSHGKESVRIDIKAYPVDSYTINLDVNRIPRGEDQLLLDIVHALGNGRIGISKIVVENLD